MKKFTIYEMGGIEMLRKIKKVLDKLAKSIIFLIFDVVVLLGILGRKEVFFYDPPENLDDAWGGVVLSTILRKPVFIAYILRLNLTPEKFVQVSTHEWIHYIIARDVGPATSEKFDNRYVDLAFNFCMSSVNENWEEYKYWRFFEKLLKKR